MTVWRDCPYKQLADYFNLLKANENIFFNTSKIKICNFIQNEMQHCCSFYGLACAMAKTLARQVV